MTFINASWIEHEFLTTCALKTKCVDTYMKVQIWTGFVAKIKSAVKIFHANLGTVA